MDYIKDTSNTCKITTCTFQANFSIFESKIILEFIQFQYVQTRPVANLVVLSKLVIFEILLLFVLFSIFVLLFIIFVVVTIGVLLLSFEYVVFVDAPGCSIVFSIQYRIENYFNE